MIKIEEASSEQPKVEEAFLDKMKRSLGNYTWRGAAYLADNVFGIGETEEEKQEKERREKLSDKSTEQLLVELILTVDSTNRSVDEISLSAKESENKLGELEGLLTEISSKKSEILDKLDKIEECLSCLEQLPLLIEKLKSGVIKEKEIEKKEIKELQILFQNSLNKMEKILKESSENKEKKLIETNKNLETLNENIKSTSKTLIILSSLFIICIGGVIGILSFSLIIKNFFQKKLLNKKNFVSKLI